MIAEIISIGDELLIGQVVNTNAAWMGQQLSFAGIRVHQVDAISDDREHILRALKEAEDRADVILITGGLGPTKDDITKTTLCEYFNTRLVFHQGTFDNIERLFGNRGVAVTELNRLQAEVPENCRVIPNIHGTAAGMWFEQAERIYVSMPGVPFEMMPMMTDFVIPELIKKTEGKAIVHKTILTQGVGESFLASTIESWEDQLPENIKLAYLPSPGIVRLRLSAFGSQTQVLQEQVDREVAKLREIIPSLIFGYDEQTLEQIIGDLLKERKMTLATAESCTGGYLAHRITSVPGSSAYFLGSIISYSNEVKKNLLGVQEADLQTHGAVSEAVVRAMASGARQRLQADYAIAISGVAGPDGGTPEKPVGTTWIAIATPDGTMAKSYLFGEHRERNIHRTALTALNLLRKSLLQINI